MVTKSQSLQHLTRDAEEHEQASVKKETSRKRIFIQNAGANVNKYHRTAISF